MGDEPGLNGKRVFQVMGPAVFSNVQVSRDQTAINRSEELI